MGRLRKSAIWIGLVCALAVPLAAAAASPLLAWRDPVYIIAGFAGVLALALMLVQPLLAAAWLPGLSPMRSRQIHRSIGALVVAAVVIHVAGLWITSPPDVIDVLTFNSPTPFSVWGVVAMWALFATALLAALRRPLRLRPRVWRKAHAGLVTVIVVGTVVHAVLIEGTMETVSKVVLCALVVLASGKVLVGVWKKARPAPASARDGR